MIALLDAYRSGLFAQAHWVRNIIAGLVVGVVALPLAMAFAISSGARPEQGIYTAIVGGALVAIFGGSRVQIAGPTGAFVVVLVAINAEFGMAGLQLATLMAGVLLVLMGVARLGGVIKFIPAPVITGFTSGIGVIIFVGQWKDFLGLPATGGEHFHEKLINLVQVLPQFNAPTVGLAVLSLLLVLYAPRIKGLARVPGPLVAMVFATVAQSSLELPGVATIGTAFGGIPLGLPTFSLPIFSISQVIALAGPAFTIAMLGAIESLLSAVVADGMAGTKHDSNQELIGQGLANIAAPLFGGFAATGAIARTATNIRNGATSPLAGITHSLVLVAVLLFMAPLAADIPLAALAAILFVVAWNMSDVPHFMFILHKAPTADRVILLVTFILTVFVDLVVAVNVGVIIAILHFIRRMVGSVETRAMDLPLLQSELAAAGITELPAHVMVYEITGPMFFGAVESFAAALHRTHTEPKTVIMRLRQVPFIDITGIQAMQEVIIALQKRHMQVLLCEANALVQRKLGNAGVTTGQAPPDYGKTFIETLRTMDVRDAG